MPRLLPHPAALLTLLLAAPAQAGWFGDAWDSLHIDGDVGVYSGHLSGGITALNAAWGEGDAVSDAVSSIGTGQGTLWSVTGTVTLLGHDLLFNYTNNKLLDDGTQRALEGELGGGYVEDALLWLAGELRPDFGDLFGDYSQPWVRLEYGDFEGSIENAWRFGTRNGRPWFGGRDAGWTSRLLNVEAGAYLAYGEAPRDKDEYQRWRRKHRSDAVERAGVGVYLRYTSFQRPVVLGFDVDDRNGFALQGADVGMLAFGLRWDIKGCDGPWCLSAVGSFIPFTGWTWMDLGTFGDQRGVALGGGFDVRGSVNWRVAGSFQVEPYVSFRADWFFPITGNYFDADIDNFTLWAPDFLLWGPGAGLQVRL